MYNFTGFTEKANEALNYAIETAENMGHTYVGSEHLLAGLLKVDGGVASAALGSRGITANAVENVLKSTVGIGTPTVLMPSDFTPRLKYIIELALEAARSMGHAYTGTEHLLISLLKEGSNVAINILERLGASPSEILSDTVKSLNTAPGGQNAAKQGGKPNGSSKTPTLDQFGRDLTDLARQNKIDPVIGREKEIERVIQILSRRTKNNPCLIGEPGVGKTAIAEGLALKIAAGEVPDTLSGKRLVSLDLTGMVAGTKYRGDFEERIKTAIDEERRRDSVHRRDPHPHRRGRGGGRGGRRQYSQALSGARRAAGHRRDYAGRIPQAHRKRRRPRTPVPAGHRGRTQRRRSAANSARTA